MITIKEIAEQLDVSPTTVSNVIHGRTGKMSEQTRLKIEEELVKNHYVLERKGKSGQTEMKLVIVDIFFGKKEGVFTDPFCGEFFEAIERELRERGRNAVCITRNTEDDLLKKLSAYNVEGAIVLGCEPGRCESLQKRAPKPLVFVDSGEGNYDNIGLQDQEGAEKIVSYLLKQGHEKIAFFCDEKVPAASNRARFQGYCKVLEEQGIPCSSDDYYYLPPDRNLRYEVFRRFADTAKEQGYTAAFCVADLYANEAVSVFFSRGLKVPDDISVAGFDDNVYARLSRPALTTVRQLPDKKGREAVNLLMKRIYGEEVVVRSMELPTELIVRDSVGNIL